MGNPVSVLVDTAVVHNVVLVYFLGLCPFLGVSKQRSAALGMGLATTFVLGVSALVGWLIDSWLLAPMGLGFLRIAMFIVVIAGLVQFLELLLKKLTPALHAALGIYLPLITTNCAVLGTTLINSQHERGLLTSVAAGVGSGIGFMLVLLIFSGIRERLERSAVPTPFAGAPIAFVTAGILSITLMGFAGLGAH